MPNYDFDQDLPIAQKTELEVANLLVARYPDSKIISFSKTNEYDILLKVRDRFATFEVKEDFTCKKTGNVGLEFETRGKPSGIQVSKANFYVYKIHTLHEIEFYLFQTSMLKSMIAKKLYFRIIIGGDPGSNSKNYLFEYEIFVKYGKRIY